MEQVKLLKNVQEDIQHHVVVIIGKRWCDGGTKCSNCGGTGTCSGTGTSEYSEYSCDFCKATRSKYTFTCNRCGGTWVVSSDCTNCGASGVTQTHSICHSCGGDGYKECSHGEKDGHWATCDTCNGDGEYERACSHGEWNKHTYIEDCSNCSGTGCSSHSGGTHENGGICETCNKKYQNHSNSQKISDYIKTPTTHTAQYSCSVNGCTYKYVGTEEEHVWSNGICEICKYECNHEHTLITDHNETQHWKECEECDYKTEPEDHTLITDHNETQHWEECEECDYKTEPEDHTLSTNHNETQHWEECEECDYKTEPENHTLSTNHNETQHWEECEECDYKTEPEDHTYEDGKCKCGVKENSNNSDNSNNSSNNSNNSINNNNNNINNNDNNNNTISVDNNNINQNGDKTITDEEIPNTGMNYIINVLLPIIGICIINFIRMKRYNKF